MSGAASLSSAVTADLGISNLSHGCSVARAACGGPGTNSARLSFKRRIRHPSAINPPAHIGAPKGPNGKSPEPNAVQSYSDVLRHHNSSGDNSSGDRIRTCDLWVMSYAPAVFRCSHGLKGAGQSRLGVPSLPPCRTHSRRFRGVLFPNLFPNPRPVSTWAGEFGNACSPIWASC